MANPLKAYWVTYTGLLCDGKPGEEAVVEFDGTDPTWTRFLDALARGLVSHGHTQMPAVLTYGSGKVVLTAVVDAPSEGNALDFAKAAFTEAIADAGGWSDIPDGT